MSIHRQMSLLQTAAIAAVQSLFQTPQGMTVGMGTTVGNGVQGWAPSAIFMDTDAATAATRVWVNTGSITAATWVNVPVGLGAVTAGLGASLVGVEDSAGDLVAATVEAALAEIASQVELAPHADYVFKDDFDASDLYGLALVPAGWTVIDTSAAGTPTVNESPDCHGGAVELSFDNQDELQSIGLDFNDELLFDVDLLRTFECRFRAPTLNANDEIVIGMMSAQDDAPANLTEGAWISVDGAQAIHCESDDTVTRLDDQDSLAVLGNDVWCNLRIDFTTIASVEFYLDVTGLIAPTRVLAAVAFDLSTYAAGLQPAMWIVKTGGAQTTNLDVDYVKIVASRA